MPVATGTGSRPEKVDKNFCYVCGEKGHYSATCSQETAVCYNCKQPGHNSKDCPEPRAPKLCFRCQSTEHLSADCPTKATLAAADRAAATCYKCGATGHFARDCTNQVDPQRANGHHGPYGPMQTYNPYAPMSYGPPPPHHAYPGPPPMHHHPHHPHHPQMVVFPEIVCRRCGAHGHYARQCMMPPMQMQQQQQQQMHNGAPNGHVKQNGRNGGRSPVENGKPVHHHHHQQQQQQQVQPSEEGDKANGAVANGETVQKPAVSMSIICRRCCVAGHFARDCTNEMVCWCCKEPGHNGKNCPKNNHCYICKEVGHIARVCPNRESVTAAKEAPAAAPAVAATDEAAPESEQSWEA